MASCIQTLNIFSGYSPAVSLPSNPTGLNRLTSVKLQRILIPSSAFLLVPLTFSRQRAPVVMAPIHCSLGDPQGEVVGINLSRFFNQFSLQWLGTAICFDSSKQCTTRQLFRFWPPCVWNLHFHYTYMPFTLRLTGTFVCHLDRNKINGLV